MIATGFKVPVYLGSSFAFITAMSLAMKEMGMYLLPKQGLS